MGHASGEIRAALGNSMAAGQLVNSANGTTLQAVRATTKPRIESGQLFQGNNEIVIVHQNEEYNLRITRNGKLILTK
jgi:hemin uptake protein HemP